MSQSPHRPAPRPDRPSEPPAEQPHAPPAQEVPLMPEIGIVEPGLEEEGILIDIFCPG